MGEHAEFNTNEEEKAPGCTRTTEILKQRKSCISAKTLTLSHEN